MMMIRTGHGVKPPRIDFMLIARWKSRLRRSLLQNACSTASHACAILFKVAFSDQYAPRVCDCVNEQGHVFSLPVCIRRPSVYDTLNVSQAMPGHATTIALTCRRNALFSGKRHEESKIPPRWLGLVTSRSLTSWVSFTWFVYSPQ